MVPRNFIRKVYTVSRDWCTYENAGVCYTGMHNQGELRTVFRVILCRDCERHHLTWKIKCRRRLGREN